MSEADVIEIVSEANELLKEVNEIVSEANTKRE